MNKQNNHRFPFKKITQKYDLYTVCLIFDGVRICFDFYINKIYYIIINLIILVQLTALVIHLFTMHISLLGISNMITNKHHWSVQRRIKNTTVTPFHLEDIRDDQRKNQIPSLQREVKFEINRYTNPHSRGISRPKTFCSRYNLCSGLREALSPAVLWAYEMR